MKTEYAHFTNFGWSQAPECADREGFVALRKGYERLPRESWTEAEEWAYGVRHPEETQYYPE